MQDESNSVTPGSSHDTAESPWYVADIPSDNKRVSGYTLALYSEWLVLSPIAPVGGPPQPVAYPAPPAGYSGPPAGPPAGPPGERPQYVYTRRDLGSTLTLEQSALSSRLLQFHTPMGNFTSLLPDETLAQVKRWIGPVTQNDLASELRKRVAYFLPLALFFVLSSFACPSPRATTVGGVPVEPVTLGLAALLVVIYLLGRYHPRRFVFLLDALWWCIFSADVAYAAYLAPTTSVLSYAFVALGLYFMYGEARAYFQFAPQQARPSPH